MRKKIKYIEVGTHEGLVGFTMIYMDETREHVLFSKELAQDLAMKLITLVQQMEQVVPQDGITLNESVTIQLNGGKDEEKTRH